MEDAKFMKERRFGNQKIRYRNPMPKSMMMSEFPLEAKRALEDV